eukprot:8777650-Pyramimonas_sp.AAC.1
MGGSEELTTSSSAGRIAPHRMHNVDCTACVAPEVEPYMLHNLDSCTECPQQQIAQRRLHHIDCTIAKRRVCPLYSTLQVAIRSLHRMRCSTDIAHCALHYVGCTI